MELRETLEKLRGVKLRGPEELAHFIHSEGIQFSPNDLSAWGWFLTSRFGRHAATIQVPDWLAFVFRQLIADLSPKTICDPWAGIGLLIGALQNIPGIEESTALTQNQGEFILGKTLVPNANWQLGESLHLLSTLKAHIDAAASILPMNLRTFQSLPVSDASGEALTLKNDLGSLILVATSMRLNESGVGFFVVPFSFFISQRSVFHQFDALNLGLEAALALPSGTFAPFTNIPAYLIVVRRKPMVQMFVGQLTTDARTNQQIIHNFKNGRPGGSLDLGRFVDAKSFTSLDAIRTAERFDAAEQRFGAPAVRLDELASEINLGRYSEDFSFPSKENAIFIPLIGNSDVRDSVDDLLLKKQNYAQVIVDPTKSDARFVARFLNSEFGKELREQNKSGAVIPKLNKQTLRSLRVFVPDLQTQKSMLEIETKITKEENALVGLQNEIAEARRTLWADPASASDVLERIDDLSRRMGSGIGQHTEVSLEQWFETLPFPLASILRAWRSAETRDFKTKYEHLLHFFEATAEFLSVILLSVLSSNEALLNEQKPKLLESMEKQKLSLKRATFGTWKFVVEYLGKQTRQLLSEESNTSEDARNNRLLCGEMFSDPSLSLPEAVSQKDVARILAHDKQDAERLDGAWRRSWRSRSATAK